MAAAAKLKVAKRHAIAVSHGAMSAWMASNAMTMPHE